MNGEGCVATSTSTFLPPFNSFFFTIVTLLLPYNNPTAFYSQATTTTTTTDLFNYHHYLRIQQTITLREATTTPRNHATTEEYRSTRLHNRQVRPFVRACVE
eukprot:gene5606-186_t